MITFGRRDQSTIGDERQTLDLAMGAHTRTPRNARWHEDGSWKRTNLSDGALEYGLTARQFTHPHRYGTNRRREPPLRGSPTFCSAEPGFTETYQEHQAPSRTLKERLHREWARVSNRITTAHQQVYTDILNAFLPPCARSPSLLSLTKVVRGRGRYHRRLLRFPPSDCSRSPPPPPSFLGSSVLRACLSRLKPDGRNSNSPASLSVSGWPLSTAGKHLYRFTLNCNYY